MDLDAGKSTHWTFLFVNKWPGRHSRCRCRARRGECSGQYPLALGFELPEYRLTRFLVPPVFAKQVSDMTVAKLPDLGHAGGVCTVPFGVVYGVQNDTVEMCHTAPYYFFGKDYVRAGTARFRSA